MNNLLFLLQPHKSLFYKHSLYAVKNMFKQVSTVMIYYIYHLSLIRKSWVLGTLPEYQNLHHEHHPVLQK